MKYSAPFYLLAGLLPLVIAATVPRIFPEGVKTDSITGISGTNPPGMVPLGGMVAVMASTSGAWAPPTSGQCKDGFARADGVSFSGHASCTGAVITATPPNMVGSYPKGGSTSGTTGGANTQATNVALSAHSITQPVLSAHSITQPTFNVPAHYHGVGTGASLASSIGLSGSSPTLTGTTTFASTTHYHNAGSNLYAYMHVSGGYLRFRYMATGAWTSEYYLLASSSAGNGDSVAEGMEIGGYTATSTGQAGVAISGGAYSLTGSNTVTGNIGLVTGGSNGNAAFAASRATDVALSAHSLSTNVAVGDHTVTNNAVNNEPAYVEVVWVIRVK